MNKENFPIIESSPEMKQRLANVGRAGKYPWDRLQVGQSFAVGKDEISRQSLQTLAYRQAKRLGRKFRVVEHEKVYEVGCIATGTNTGSFSSIPSPAIAQVVENITPAAPLGWPTLDKTK